MAHHHSNTFVTPDFFSVLSMVVCTVESNTCGSCSTHLFFSPLHEYSTILSNKDEPRCWCDELKLCLWRMAQLTLCASLELISSSRAHLLIIQHEASAARALIYGGHVAWAWSSCVLHATERRSDGWTSCCSSKHKMRSTFFVSFLLNLLTRSRSCSCLQQQAKVSRRHLSFIFGKQLVAYHERILFNL